ncbi:MAG: autotransporter-associated beta strand repeat-containing protein, partial [Phycisphaerae bacterium]
GNVITVQGAVENSYLSSIGNLIKADTGTLILNGSNTYTGNTQVLGGRLQVTNSLPNNGSAKVLIAKDGNGIMGDGFGDAQLVRRVISGATYAGQGSSITGLATGELATTADLLAGTAGSQADVGMAWRTRGLAEKNTASHGLVSEVLSLSGIALNGGGTHNGSSQTDLFVLQMSYNPTALTNLTGLTEAQAAAQNILGLGYLDLGPDGLLGTADDTWLPAVNGNFGGTVLNVGNHSYTSTYFVLGDYGVDTTNHVVWAVLNHNSQFAALVPEPASLTILAWGATALMVRRRKDMK